MLILRTLRAHQWVKNILVFVPMIMAHRISEPELWLQCFSAFVAFCSVASGTYIINDILDLDSDRQHRTKRNRPIASGAIGIGAARVLSLACFGAGLGFGLLLPRTFLFVLSTYLVTTLLYSVALKRVVAGDIVVLAFLYALRVLAGGVACEVPVSQWLLAFSVFFFFSLAAIKRFSELSMLKELEQSAASGRGYRVIDLELLSNVGSAGGLLSVLVLALYVTSNDISRLYANEQLILLLCPLLLYWIVRIWILAHRGEMHDDPIVFALSDRCSYLVGAATAVILLIASAGIGAV